ncbi:nodal modulator 1 [Cimex lectularius]|uniref:Nodal modulator n=1 Tax=Cimex lectularius TaxID=79782 RepID=A0A8I6RRV4_CIMLE|nr:nodal modulator 1 [Cimex lectularius]
MYFSGFFLGVFLIFLSSAPGGFSDDILGCNGFVKSHVDINYSLVEIKLFTKQGSLKDHTDCAPNNGYYFLPIYDKGEYVLKISPPDGWYFEPSEVPVTIDGATDPCSTGKDINFTFKGFAIIGQVVSWGHKVGPVGVTVELFSNSSNSPTSLIQTTTTREGGEFRFSPITSGKYKIKISHPRWKVKAKEVDIEVNNSNGLVKANSLAIAGYDVLGRVTSDGQPITGVSFVLFSKEKNLSVDGCETSTLPGFTGDGLSLEGLSYVCHVLSNDKGIFTFPQLSPGSYVLVPHYKGSKSTKFDVHPRTLPFALEHGSVELPVTFQVKGFTVSGRVLWGPDGKPMSGAKVSLNGKVVFQTSADGVYNLESMRAGTYKINVQAPNVVFEEKEIKVSSTMLPDLFPKSYQVCGNLHSPTSSGPYNVDVVSESGVKTAISTDSKGSYCLFLTPGKYTFSPVIGRAQINHGLMFSPASREVVVSDNVLNNINFSQLKCTVKGKIVCMSVCPLITINLKPKSVGGALQTIAKGGVYEFTDVMPGDYDVYIEPGLGWCWDKESLSLNVFDETTVVPTFTQSGFTVTIISSHSTKVVYYSESDSKDKQDLNVGPGSTHICVPKATPYIFEPVGCHGYEEPRVKWITGSVSLTAINHANTFYIESTDVIDDLVLEVFSENKLINKVVPKVSTRGKDSVKYETTLQLKEDEVVTLVAKAGLFLFNPLSYKLKGGADCVNTTHPVFTAEKGQVIKGKITTGKNKGLGDVVVQITDESGEVIATQKSSGDGTYIFPPIKIVPNFKIIPEKEGYVLTALEKLGDFSAHKLAEIIVKVKDANTSEFLQGVLLSLSGGESYRRNAQTNVNGTMSFLSLSPGEYFLRPMMKEYKFHPTSKMIKVNEGSTVEISLSGERVAYSGIGEVTSLNGEGESGVVVEAIGLGSCNLLQEEATSGDVGVFRIRGLKPKCKYNVRVKQDVDVNHHIHTSMPDNITIEVDNSDVSGIRLYAMRPSTRIDVAVYVVPDNPEDLKTLKVRLSREESPDAAVHVAKLADFKPSPSGYSVDSMLITMPPILADGRGYILQLESSLSQATHEYVNRPIHFKAAGSFKLFRLPFSPKIKSRDAELSQSSYLILPLILMITFAYYNKDLLVSVIKLVLQKVKVTTTLNKQHSDDSSSEPFTDYPKKKSKSRKT